MTTEDKKKIVKAKLPKGWSNTTLQDVSVITMGQSPKGEYTTLESNYTPLVGGAADLKNKSIQPSKYTKKPTRLCKVGDIIVCVRATIGRASVADKVYCLGRGVAGFTPLCDRDWLLFFFEAFEQNLTNLGKGVTFVQIDKKSIQEFPVALPPLNEQKRIVAKIEELFSELDAGEQSLRDARKQLTLYRQSLLKQAFEGKLTEQWRANNPDKLEAPATLLTRIQQERESSYATDITEWESAHQMWIDAGETGKKPPKPKKHKVQISNTTHSYINFPDDWNSFNLSELVLALRQGWSPKCHNHSVEIDTWSVMTTTAIQAGKFIETANKELPKDLHARPWITLKMNDILITRAGPRSRCGIVCRVSKNMPKMMLCDKAYRLRFPTAIISPNFMELLLISPGFSKCIEALKTGINDSGVNITQNGFLQLKVAIPSFQEQQEIVRLLDEQFTAIEQNEKEINHALTQSQALRQSILKKAFEGELL